MEMALELCERDNGFHRFTILHQMEIVAVEVDHHPAVHSSDGRPSNGPFWGHFPVEHRGSGGHLMDLEWDMPGDVAQCLPQTTSGDATADREQRLDMREKLGADIAHRIRIPEELGMIFQSTGIQGLYGVILERNVDDRGSFARTFCQRQFTAQGLCSRFVQAS